MTRAELSCERPSLSLCFPWMCLGFLPAQIRLLISGAAWRFSLGGAVTDARSSCTIRVENVASLTEEVTSDAPKPNSLVRPYW